MAPILFFTSGETQRQTSASGHPFPPPPPPPPPPLLFIPPLPMLLTALNTHTHVHTHTHTHAVFTFLGSKSYIVVCVRERESLCVCRGGDGFPCWVVHIILPARTKRRAFLHTNWVAMDSERLEKSRRKCHIGLPCTAWQLLLATYFWCLSLSAAPDSFVLWWIWTIPQPNTDITICLEERITIIDIISTMLLRATIVIPTPPRPFRVSVWPGYDFRSIGNSPALEVHDVKSSFPTS